MNKHFKTVIHFWNHYQKELNNQIDRLDQSKKLIGVYELALVIKAGRADEFGIALMEDINVLSVEKFNQWVENLEPNDSI